MKLWFKFYYVAVILIIMAIAIIGINFIETDFLHILENKAAHYTNNAESMARTMEDNISLNEITYGNASVVLDTLVDSAKFYESSINSIEMNYEIFYQSYSCYSSFNKAFIKFEAIDRGSYMPKDEMQYKIKDGSNGKYLAVNVPIRVKQGDYSLMNYYDLSDVYNAKMQNYQFLIISSAFVLIITLVVLFWYTRYITSPLNSLMVGTKALEDGDYSYRVNVNSGDEFEVIGREFNAMAKAVEKVNERHDRLNEKQASFIANFTHELRTPLTSLMGFSQLLQASDISDDDKKLALDHILSEGGRLVELSKQMSTLMELENNTFDMAWIDINLLFKSISQTFMHRLEDYHIVFDTSDHLKIWGNEDLIKMCYINLIDNAIKASKKGSSIFVICQPNVNGWTLQVRDQGVGISKENLERVSEAFFMGDRSREKAVGSMGLGLALCDRIAKLHDGRLNIESMENVGTVITINISRRGEYYA